ncbi:MAG TPA: hypothetical protein VFX59_25040 [Polyangiales bacterium]|nr:hypothetical protein [Polyangiales bacterium]
MKLWWALALSACAPEGEHATAIAISVKSELALRALDYRVYRANADLGSALPLSSLTVTEAQLAQPFVVVRGAADAFLISIEGYEDRTQPPVITYQAQVHFVPEQTMALRVLLARVCYQRDCGFPGLTCYGQSWGSTAAGTCAAIPTPELVQVTRVGEESDW